MRTAKYNLRLRVYRDTGETEVVTTKPPVLYRRKAR